MSTGRMEAFSDGVIAILITVMVLELPKPHGVTWSALDDSYPVLLAYVLSFIYLGIYWNNHHHMLQATHRVSGGILWGNLHLLFWLSLVPFTTSWLGENELSTVTAAAYGINLLAAAVAFFVLQRLIIRDQGPGSVLARRGRPRPEGQGLPDPVRAGDRPLVRRTAARRRPLRGRRADLARPRPPAGAHPRRDRG